MCLLLLTGCGTPSQKVQELESDVKVKDCSNEYFNEQTLRISINNGYRCTNVTQEFNEDTQEYTITVTIFKPIKENN